MSPLDQLGFDFDSTTSPMSDPVALASRTAPLGNEQPRRRTTVRSDLGGRSNPATQADFFTEEVAFIPCDDADRATGKPRDGLPTSASHSMSRGAESMTADAIARTPPTVAPAARPVHFGEALALIEASGLLSDAQLRKHRSYVTVTAKALQKVDRNPDLTLLPCEPRQLRKALEGFHPAQAHIKNRQWIDILSGLRRIQRATGWLRPKERRCRRTGTWNVFVGCANSKGLVEALRRFANFCTEIAVEPAEVTHDTFERYLDYLEQNTMTRNPRGSVRSTRAAWNKLCRQHPELGVAPLPKRPRYNLVATRAEELPHSFHKRVEAYLARCAAPDPFDLDFSRPLAAETLRERKTYIYLGIQYLLESGVSADQLNDLSAICSPDAIRQILREQFRRHSPDGQSWPPGAKPMVSHFATMAAQIGRLSDAELAEIRKLVERVPKPKRGFPKKTRERLAVFDDERVLRDFVALPAVLWKEAMELEKSGRWQTARAKAKYAIALAILLTKPLRIGELASVDFTTDFRRDRKGRINLLYIPGDRTKTGNPAEAALDDILGKRIGEYFERFARPTSGAAGSFLFPSGTARHVNSANFASGLKKEIWRHLGIQFNSHLARALVATIILDADPNAGPIAQRMLGHMDVETTYRHYGLQRGRAAQRQFEAFLSRALRGGRS